MTMGWRLAVLLGTAGVTVLLLAFGAVFHGDPVMGRYAAAATQFGILIGFTAGGVLMLVFLIRAAFRHGAFT